MTDRFNDPWSGIGVGGSVALDLANTLDWRLRAEPAELLRTYEDLVRWGRSAKILDADAAAFLRLWGRDHRRLAAAALARTQGIREAMAAIFQAKVHGRSLPGDALPPLESAYRKALGARALTAGGPSLEWSWRDREPEPDRIAWAAVMDAVDLLQGPDAERIRQCADAECGWFFLDTSRNRSRRWCTMESCGNRNKVRSFYRRSVGRA